MPLSNVTVNKDIYKVKYKNNCRYSAVIIAKNGKLKFLFLSVIISVIIYIYIIQFTTAQKLSSFNMFLHETKESGRNKRRSVLRTEILIVQIDDNSC